MASSDAGAAPQLSAIVDVPGAAGLPEAEFRKALESALFRRWLESLQAEKGLLVHGKLSLRQVLIQGVDIFKADIVDEETKAKIPGIVFARGPAVAVLILLESKGQTYAVLTEQARVPIGKFILELPAGMLDDENGDFVGTAVREVEEETGIKLNLHDMVDLTALLDPSTGTRLFPLERMCIAARGLPLIPPCEPVWRDDTKLVHGNIKSTNILPDWFSETPARRVQRVHASAAGHITTGGELDGSPPPPPPPKSRPVQEHY